MANLNRVLLIGRLTRDPELRYTPSGTSVADLGLAVNRNYTKSDGTRVEETCFIDITVWGRQAENCHKYLAKGRQVFVEGRLKLDTWENKEGKKRSKIQVVADTVQFLDRAPDSGGGGGRRDQGSQSGSGGGSNPFAEDEFGPDEDEEIPF